MPQSRDILKGGKNNFTIRYDDYGVLRLLWVGTRKWKIKHSTDILV